MALPAQPMAMMEAYAENADTTTATPVFSDSVAAGMKQLM